MRLLLDEHYSPEIARALREWGHDVVSAKERPDLQGRSDADLLARMAAERRAIVTEDWADFSRLMAEADPAAPSHFGVLFTSRHRMPRRREAIGLFVRVLDGFLGHHPAEDALLGRSQWLPQDGDGGAASSA